MVVNSEIKMQIEHVKKKMRHKKRTMKMERNEEEN